MAERLSPKERYQIDPMFRQLVDMLQYFLGKTPEMTPTELREAAALAATMHEMYNVRPIMIDRDELTRWRGL